MKTKWKVLLAVMCAVLASIGLFACKKGSGSDITNTTKFEYNNKTTSELTYTDSDTWSDIEKLLNEKAKVTAIPAKGDSYTVSGAECDITSTIKFDSANHCAIGRYTITLTPKKNNPKKHSRLVNVVIEHDFKADTEREDREICEYCAATKTSADEDVIIHYGSFHSHGSTATGIAAAVHGNDGSNGNAVYFKEPSDYIKQFGTVKNASGNDITIPTLTVGQLEPGMTITVKGTAETSWSKWGLENDAGYYFPVIGIADRTNNAPIWDGGSALDNYSGGGTSVFVRGEGWVLYNGIDGSHTGATDYPRMLSALGAGSDGSGESHNYGSLDTASHESTEKVPNNYTQGHMPSNSAEWTDWVVYSTGVISQSAAYSAGTEIELTWNYREDSVIELTYSVNGAKLIAYIKVPASSTGYYDTMLHGDYVDMHITSYERIETRTPHTFAISVSNDTYYEGQTFNPSTVSATFTYEQTGSTPFPQALTLENIYATTAELTDETVKDADKTDWVSLATNPVLTSYKTYIVKVTKGGLDWYKTFEADAIKVVPNILEFAFGADVDTFKNNNTVGNLTISTDGTSIKFKPVDTVYGQYITDGSSFNETPAAGSRYVALQLGSRAALGETITANVPYKYDKDNKTLVLALTKTDTTVTVEGMNGNTNTNTVFDFSGIKGFSVEASVEQAYGSTGWKLNNSANEVTITFKGADSATISQVYIDGYTIAPAALNSLSANVDQPTFTLLNDSTTGYDAATGTVTLHIEYKAANLNPYAQRVIRAQVDGDYDFEYKLDYVAELVNDDTVDAGYYNYIASRKIYLVKPVTEGDDNLALNVNAGDDNVALLNLAYTYADGKATLKDRSLKGVAISVLNIGGKDVVMIEVDPTEYSISTTRPFGYQFKTGDGFSTYYYAVSGNTVERKTVVNTDLVILNNGSCIDTGKSGLMQNTTVGSNNTAVTFVASVSEFGGSHQYPNSGISGKCQLCGQTISRVDFLSTTTITLHDGEFTEFSGKYNGNFTQIYHGNNLKLYVGSDYYWLRNDGFFAINGTGGENIATGENIWSSFGDDAALRTPNGKLDADGKEITETTFKETMKAGALLRVWVGYQDETITINWRLYKSGDATDVTGYGDKLYFGFTYKISGVTENDIKLEFGFDQNQIGNNPGSHSSVWWFKDGKLDNSIISSATGSDSSDLVVGNIENHYANVSAVGGNVSAITSGVETSLGLSGEHGYVKYYTTTVTLSEAYASGGIAKAEVYSDAAQKNKAPAAVATISGATITVTVAFKADGVPGTYYVKLTNNKGYTKQCDIKLDLSAVSMYDLKANVTSSPSIVAGGTATIAYSGDDLTSATKISINGSAAKALEASMTFDGISNVTWNSNTLSFSVDPHTLSGLTSIPEYTVVLYNDAGDVLSTTVIKLTKLPADNDAHVFMIDENTFAYAVGGKLYLYFFNAAASGPSSDSLVFNANNSDTPVAKILPYNLAYSLSGTQVAFKEANELTKNHVAGTYLTSGDFKVTQLEINLDYLGITTKAYYFELLRAAVTDSATYYTVAETARTITSTTVNSLGTKELIAENSCTSIGSKGYEIGSKAGYYGIEGVPSHTWVLHKDVTRYECSVCHAVLGPSDVSQKDMPAMEAIETESIVDTGLTISFVNSNTAPNEWTQAIATKGGINFALLCLDPYWNSLSSVADATEEMKTLAAKLYKTNSYPGMGGGTMPLGSGCFVGTTSYMTLTISVDGGIYAYKDGEFAFNYSATAGMNVNDATDKTGKVADFAKLFLLVVEKYGFTFGSGISASDAIVQRGVLDADQVKQRYELYQAEKNYLPAPHEHSYVGDVCTCGAINPKHGTAEGLAHSYVNDACSICGRLCRHDFKVDEDGTCTICGHYTGKKSVETTHNSAVNGDWTKKSVMVTLDKPGADVDYNEAVFTATFTKDTGNAGWAGVLTRIFDGTTEAAFFQGNNNVLNYANKLGTLAAGAVAEYASSKVGYSCRVTIRWEGTTITSIYEMWENGHDAAVAQADKVSVMTFTNVTQTTVNVFFGLDSVESNNAVSFVQSVKKA